jgi:hypothetical protein
MIALERIGIDAPRGSDAWYLALLGRPHFRLVSSSSGRLDYIETIRQWRKRFAAPSRRKTLLKLQLLPRWLTSPDFRLAFTAGVSANSACFERELPDHHRLVFENRRRRQAHRLRAATRRPRIPQEGCARARARRGSAVLGRAAWRRRQAAHWRALPGASRRRRSQSAGPQPIVVPGRDDAAARLLETTYRYTELTNNVRLRTSCCPTSVESPCAAARSAAAACGSAGSGTEMGVRWVAS